MASPPKMSLNPAAPEFVPSSYKSDSGFSAWPGSAEECSEDHITPEELEELEAAERWVELQAEMESEEQDHLVEVALRYAPEARVNEIRRRFGVTPAGAGQQQHKGIHARARAW